MDQESSRTSRLVVLCEKYRCAVALTKIDLLQSLAHTRPGSDTQSKTFTQS